MSSLHSKSDEQIKDLYSELTQEMFERGIALKTAHLGVHPGLTEMDYPLALVWRECMAFYFGVKMTGGKSYLRMWEFMLRKFGKPMTKDGVLEFTYFDRPNDMPEDKIVDVYVCHFRRMLKLIPGEPFFIETIWGTGHKLRFTEVTTTLEDGVKLNEAVIRSLFADIHHATQRQIVADEVGTFDKEQVNLRNELDKRSVAA